MVTIYDLMTAREWLEVNEGLDGESEACQRVAEFLTKEIQRRVNEAARRKAQQRQCRRVLARQDP